MLGCLFSFFLSCKALSFRNVSSEFITLGLVLALTVDADVLDLLSNTVNDCLLVLPRVRSLVLDLSVFLSFGGRDNFCLAFEANGHIELNLAYRTICRVESKASQPVLNSRNSLVEASIDLLHTSRLTSLIGIVCEALKDFVIFRRVRLHVVDDLSSRVNLTVVGASSALSLGHIQDDDTVEAGRRGVLNTILFV